jgi:hypothetical protein
MSVGSEMREASIDDIFADVRKLVSAVPEGRKKRVLEGLVDVKVEEFYRAYDDSRYQANGQDAYGLLRAFVGTIKEELREDDAPSRAVADFIGGFCGDMVVMWGTRAKQGETHFGRIAERMLRYAVGMEKLRYATGWSAGESASAVENVADVMTKGVESASERYVGEVMTKILEVWEEVELTSSTAEFVSLPCMNVLKCVKLLWGYGPVNHTRGRWSEKYHGRRDAYVLGIIGQEVRPLLAAAVADNGLANALFKSRIAALRAFVETGWSDVVGASVESVSAGVAHAAVLAGGAGASMHALLRQLDALG